MKLQELTGLSDVDPIHRHLGIVDKFLGDDHDWSERKLPRKDLIRALWLCLGHPVQYPTVEEYCLDNFQEYLQQKGEPVIAEIVHKTRQRIADNHAVRIVMIWLIANIDYLKERYLEEGFHHRKITADWTPSVEE